MHEGGTFGSTDGKRIHLISALERRRQNSGRGNRAREDASAKVHGSLQIHGGVWGVGGGGLAVGLW